MVESLESPISTVGKEHPDKYPDDKEILATKEKEAQAERNRRWEMAHAPRIREIIPGLCLGNVRVPHMKTMLEESRINAIVSLTGARWTWWKTATREAGIPEHRHKWVQCADSSTQDLLVYMSDICDFIERMASPALRESDTLPVEHGLEPVLSDTSRHAGLSEAIMIHCGLGISRSPAVIIAYLMRKYGMKREDVQAFVQTKQRVKPSANLIRQLQVWEQMGYQVWEDEERTVPKAPYQEFLDYRKALLRKKGLTGNEPFAPLSL